MGNGCWKRVSSNTGALSFKWRKLVSGFKHQSLYATCGWSLKLPAAGFGFGTGFCSKPKWENSTGSVKQPGRTDSSWAMAPDLELPWWGKDCQHRGRLHASGTEMSHNGPGCMEHTFQRSSLTPWLPLLSLWMLFPGRSGAGLIPNNLEGLSISLWLMIDFWRETLSTTSQSLPTVLKQT